MAQPSNGPRKHAGSCHCGATRFVLGRPAQQLGRRRARQAVADFHLSAGDARRRSLRFNDVVPLDFGAKIAHLNLEEIRRRFA